MNVNWERLWRSSGINFVVFFIIAYVVYGNQPKVGASAEKLVSFYDGDRTRILISTVIFGLAVLNLLWFAAAITSTLRDAGQGGWGAAATAASAALGALFFLLIIVGAALAYSTIVSFPAAMLIMAGSFGLWRAGIISSALFSVGVAAVVLVLLGGTTWASNGFWAPDGAYSRFISPIIGLAWVAIISGLLVMRAPSTARAAERREVPAT
jgi:hypothetical protein